MKVYICPSCGRIYRSYILPNRGSIKCRYCNRGTLLISK